MNIKKYLDIILMKLSKEYKINVVKITTYKDVKKYTLIKTTLSKENHKDKIIETYTERDLLLKLKELI